MTWALPWTLNIITCSPTIKVPKRKVDLNIEIITRLKSLLRNELVNVRLILSATDIKLTPHDQLALITSAILRFSVIPLQLKFRLDVVRFFLQKISK